MWRYLLFLGLGACAARGAAPARASALPAFDVVTVDGQASSLQAALGASVGVVDLWATWCTACRREQPKLERLQAAYAGQGLRVIGLDVGEAPDAVRAYLAENPISYPTYLDPDFRVADALGDNQLPTLLVIDQGGRIAHRSASLDQATLDALKAALSARTEN